MSTNIDGSDQAVGSKGLSAGSLGLVGSIVLGISCVAPAYTLTAAVGPTAATVGEHLPAIFLVGFIPMLLVALGYRELNSAEPDSGTSFTWATKAFGPWVGWMGGWGLIVATVIVLSNLAGVAVDFFYLCLGQIFDNDSLTDLTTNKAVNIATCAVFVLLATWVSYRGVQESKRIQYALLAFQLIVLVTFAISAIVRSGGMAPERASRSSGSTRSGSRPGPPSPPGSRYRSSSTGVGTCA